MDTLGDIVRQQREEKGLPLRIVAGFLNIDQAILSKIERGQRKASKEQVLKLAEYFNVDKEQLLVAWLSDRIVYELNSNENLAIQALKVAEQKFEYKKTNQCIKKNLWLHSKQMIVFLKRFQLEQLEHKKSLNT